MGRGGLRNARVSSDALAEVMDHLYFALLVLVTWTDEIGKDIWHWVLANFNMSSMTPYIF